MYGTDRWQAANDNQARGRLAAELEYGLPALGDRFTQTPHAGYALTDSAREYTLGLRFGLAGGGDTALDLELGATRTEAIANDEVPEHRVGFRVRARVRASW